MSPKPKAPADKKTKAINVPLTESKFQAVSDYCWAHRIHMSAWINALIDAGLASEAMKQK